MDKAIVVIEAIPEEQDRKAEEQARKEREDKLARLNALGQALASKRKEDIEWREQSGVEDRWDEDQEAYDGIDDANRAEQKYIKPASSTGRLTLPTRKTSGSTVFVNITAPYVDMAAARVADMLLPTDDKPFGINHTPIPDLDGYEKSEEVEQLPDGSAAPVKDLAKAMKDKAAEIAEKAETRIWDWLVESQWHGEVRKVIEDAARIGVGVLKGPCPAKKKIQKLSRDEMGSLAPAFEYDTKPTSKRIDVRNLYPAKGCGESIHNGGHIWERDYFTKKQLADLLGSDYIDEQIEICLKEGPGGSTDPRETSNDEKQSLYEAWYYHGQIEADDMAAAGCECED